MTAQAIAKRVRISARKARLAADLIRGEKVPRAIAYLTHSPNKSASLVLKVLKSALANAAYQDESADVDNYRVTVAYVNEGTTMKRFRPRAMGRAGAIRKRTSHITVEVGE